MQLLLKCNHSLGIPGYRHVAIPFLHRHLRRQLPHCRAASLLFEGMIFNSTGAEGRGQGVGVIVSRRQPVNEDAEQHPCNQDQIFLGPSLGQ